MGLTYDDLIAILAISMIIAALNLYLSVWMNDIIFVNSLCYPAVERDHCDYRPVKTYTAAEVSSLEGVGDTVEIKARSLEEAQKKARAAQESQWTIMVLCSGNGDMICHARDGQDWVNA